MPRAARVKPENAVYHIIIKSISEVYLFNNNCDKDNYISIMKHYQTIYKFRVYAYCFMSNHAHFIIDPNGADISKIMHSINFKFAMTFNKKYKREGPLFKDRFKSKIIHSDRYLLLTSAYIHKNPMVINQYKSCPEKYKYSSLSTYLGLKKDPFKIVEEDFIMTLLNDNVKKSRKQYLFLLFGNDELLEKELKIEDNKTEYKSEKTLLVRNFKPMDIINFIASKLQINKIKLHIKNHRDYTKARALVALMMRSLCDFRCKDICEILGNITQSRVSTLCTMGANIIKEDNKFKDIIYDFISLHSA